MLFYSSSTSTRKSRGYQFGRQRTLHRRKYNIEPYLFYCPVLPDQMQRNCGTFPQALVCVSLYVCVCVFWTNFETPGFRFFVGKTDQIFETLRNSNGRNETERMLLGEYGQPGRTVSQPMRELNFIRFGLSPDRLSDMLCVA